MARRRPKPEPEPRELTIEESEAALRAWAAASRKRPERIRSACEQLAKAVLLDFDLPDDLGPHLLTDLPAERGRAYWKRVRKSAPEPTDLLGSPQRVWLNDYLRPETTEWRAAEILVSLREAEHAKRPEDELMWITRAVGMGSGMKWAPGAREHRSRGGRMRAEREAAKDHELAKGASNLKNAPRSDLGRAKVLVQGYKTGKLKGKVNAVRRALARDRKRQRGPGTAST